MLKTFDVRWTGFAWIHRTVHISTALTCLSGAPTMPTAPDEHGAQTSRAQRGALAPGMIMGRTGFVTTLPRARAIKNYHRPTFRVRYSVRGQWEGDGQMDGRCRRSGASAVVQVQQSS